MAATSFFFVLLLTCLVPVLDVLPVVSASTNVNASANVNMCDWSVAAPSLYHEYYPDDCPPRYYLRSNGECETEWAAVDLFTCAGFCQIRTTFYYGQEQPYVRVPMCRGEMTCTIAESVHQNYAWKAKVNGNFKYSALTVGITSGYSEKSGISQSYKFSKHLQKDECGYFTFIPFIRGVCGTYTEGYMEQTLCHPYRTVGNACVEELVGFDTNDNIKDWRTVRGVVAFVYLDCLTLAPAPDDKQDVAWLQPGVRLPRDNGLLIQAYEDLWNRSAEVSMASQNGDAVCYDAVANATECVVAANDHLMLGMMVVQTDSGAKKGKGYELTVNNTCSTYFTYDEDWKGQDCSVSHLEIAAAAQAIIDTCIKNDMIGGSHVVRAAGNCACTVSFRKH
ncbi:hypothetical protein LTR20_003069 [Exophiala xenobiotica]|nr:hypothetical protein LTS13_000292 [Exophiala xenobiotica]KAK5403429.1 hypothetical protein LTR79_000182 [Exophiala xenobiotica]KAK5422917.1 hypothetical protein LTR90_001935 [Exophiala xenobiotica]KAK5468723.1 hypothetical protein LTR20_003069 [Exophiala xenobiotica]KAK5495443.1 hypothetical protein LTR26_002059 [Exophiala xenobiotica]